MTLAPPSPTAAFAAARHGLVAVEYAVSIGTLAAVIVAAFTGLSGKFLTLLSHLAI